MKIIAVDVNNNINYTQCFSVVDSWALW